MLHATGIVSIFTGRDYIGFDALVFGRAAAGEGGNCGGVLICLRRADAKDVLTHTVIAHTHISVVPFVDGLVG